MTHTDNLGLLIALLFRSVTTSALTSSGTPFVNSSGVARDIQIYGTNNQQVFAEAGGSATAQIGEGSTEPTRQDFDIEDPFSVAPESLPQTSQAGGYSTLNRVVQQPTQISPTGGAGTITEVAKFKLLRVSTGVNENFLFFRNLVNPTAFIIAQTVDVSNVVTI